MGNKDKVQLPADLTAVSADELTAFERKLVARFDALNDGDASPEALTEMAEIAESIETVRGQLTERANATVEANRQRDELKARIHGQDGDKSDDDTDGDDEDKDDADADKQPAEVKTLEQPAAPAPVDVEAIAAAAARGAAAAFASIGDRSGTNPGDLAVASLRDSQRAAPPTGVRPAGRQVVTAGADIRGIARGSEFDNLGNVVDAFHQRARQLGVSRSGSVEGPLVASLRNSFEHTVDERSPASAVQEIIEDATSRPKQQALLAAGGWCAPSEIRYDFFNVAGSDGVIDLPTVGINRGGLRWPTSPSLADVFSGTFSNATNPWLWTEADDIAAITGSPTKPCVRVPCPAFNEARLEAYGICLTAGNLADDAYPEATANYLKLLLAAHEHAMNQRYIQTMVSLSSAAVTGGGFATSGAGTAAPLLGALELTSIDYRTRYGMASSDVLEAVLPAWMEGPIRADLAKRTGVDPNEAFRITRADIDAWFAVRRVRVQFVQDWQVRTATTPGSATALTNWPTTVQFMLYAAGTFLRGNGLQLDLGVVRDSVLNATNDHTAAWSEEAHLIARVGNESRLYTLNFCTDGTTGANDLVACGL